jgi:DNA-binding CsgD family transcriptional regulator
MHDKKKNTDGSVFKEGALVDDNQRNLASMLDRLEKQGTRRIPEKVSDIIGRIERELELLENQIDDSDESGSKLNTTIDRISASQINLYRNAVLQAIASVCTNIMTNTREIERLNDIITRLPKSTGGEFTLKRMLANIDSSKGEAPISRREREVLIQLLGGKTNREISRELGISEKTVKNHLWRIYRKLGVENRTQLFNRLITT